mgnify:CR=1 FL=1
MLFRSNAFAFGYGAYTSVTPDLAKTKINKNDVTDTSKMYGLPFSFDPNAKGYLYLADFPLTKDNSIFLYETPESQPEITEKLVKAGILEKDEKSGGYRTTKAYGGGRVYNMHSMIDQMGKAYAHDMLQSGYLMSGLNETKPSANSFSDKFGIKQRIASELANLGIDVSLAGGIAGDIYAIIHKPEKFNNALVGKYTLDRNGGIATVSGRPVNDSLPANDSLLAKIQDAFKVFKRKKEKFKLKPEDLPSRSEGKRFSFRREEPEVQIRPEEPEKPRKIGARIVGAPPGVTSEQGRTALVKRMTNLLSHPYSMLADAKDWYERSGQSIREFARGNKDLMEKTIRLMALYSQANSVGGKDRKSTRLNSSHVSESRMPSSA